MSLYQEIMAGGFTSELASKDYGAIAAALSVGRTARTATEIGNGTVLEVMGITDGNTLLDFLFTTTDFRYVKVLLEQGRLRIDLDMVRSTLDALVPSVISLVNATVYEDTNLLKVKISGGADTVRYKITVLTTTTNGLVFEDELTVLVGEI